MALRSSNLGDVKVGSTEMFQGQERRVIIISILRSSQAWVDFDAKHNLGFSTTQSASTWRSRARRSLIVVGNPMFSRRLPLA